jgi:hypothetical protein
LAPFSFSLCSLLHSLLLQSELISHLSTLISTLLSSLLCNVYYHLLYSSATLSSLVSPLSSLISHLLFLISHLTSLISHLNFISDLSSFLSHLSSPIPISLISSLAYPVKRFIPDGYIKSGRAPYYSINLHPKVYPSLSPPIWGFFPKRGHFSVLMWPLRSERTESICPNRNRRILISKFPEKNHNFRGKSCNFWVVFLEKFANKNSAIAIWANRLRTFWPQWSH